MSEQDEPAPADDEPATQPVETQSPIDCPPPAERPAAPPALDPRGELLRLAAELARTRSARLMAEYLRLRRLYATTGR